jgi:hydrogenase maturation protease
MHLVVVGIGQSFRGDDGAGLAAVETWRKSYSSAQDPRMRIELTELPGLALLDLLADAQAAIIVDAIKSGRTPGTILLLNQDDLAAFGKGSRSAHGWGVAETLTLGKQLEPEKLPVRLSMIAIEAGGLELGHGLSQEVQNALPHAAHLIEEQVQRFLVT